MSSRGFKEFSWKDTNLKVASRFFDPVTAEIVAHRRSLEAYIKTHPEFRSSLVPVDLRDHAPTVARRMHAASLVTGLGPMASVAGALAQIGVEKAMALGDTDAIVENGGDIFMVIAEPLVVGIFAGDSPLGQSLAFSIQPQECPLSLCSSSSRLGHSLSLGDCDLACVVAPDGALADSAATLLCNLIRTEDDLKGAVDKVMGTPGLRGVLAVKGGRIALAGSLPALVRNADANLTTRITVDRRSSGR